MQTRKNTVSFKHVFFHFISLYLFVLTFAMKLKDANYKKYYFATNEKWCQMKKYMSHEEISDFVSCPLFGFTIVIKLRNFDFESLWITVIFYVRICPMQKCLNLFNFHWLGLLYSYRHFDFKSHWNTLIFFDQQHSEMITDLIVSVK